MRFDISQLSRNVFLGDANLSKSIEKLRDLGITSVVNLTPQTWGWPEVGFNELHLPIDDGFAFSPYHVKKFFEVMTEWIGRDDIVLIHCHMGVSRTSAFAIGWHMYQKGCTSRTDSQEGTDLRTEWSKSEDIVRIARPGIDPHYLLKRTILHYFSTLP